MTVSLERTGKKIMVRDPERKRLAELMGKLPLDVQVKMKEIEEIQQRVRERKVSQAQ